MSSVPNAKWQWKAYISTPDIFQAEEGTSGKAASGAAGLHRAVEKAARSGEGRRGDAAGTNCIKIGLPGKIDAQ